MPGHTKGKRVLRTFGCVLAVFCLLFTALEVAGPRAASAQTAAQVDVGGDYFIEVLDGQVVITASFLAGDTPVAAMAFEIMYDPSIIRPVLQTDPNQGTVDAPACIPRTFFASVTCGPTFAPTEDDPRPTAEKLATFDTLRVAFFRTSGAFTDASTVTLVDIPFTAIGVAGVSDLEVQVVSLLDTDGQPITPTGVGTDGSVTVVAPVDAVDDSGSGAAGVSATYDVATNDVDVLTGAGFSLTGVDTAVNIPSINTGTGVITYTPALSEAGQDVTIEYEVCPDGVAGGSPSCDTATLTIAVDVLPIDAVDDSGSGVVGVADTYAVAGNDVNVPAGADFSLTGVDTAVNAPSIDANTGVITYTPDPAEAGDDVTVEYEVCPDGVAGGSPSCDIATLTIAVALVPIDAVDDSGSGVVGVSDTYDVATNDVDVLAGADFSLTGTDTAVNVPSINANTGVITYTPAVSEAGADVTIEYEVCPDGVAGGSPSCDIATLTIAVALVPIDAVDDSGSGVVGVSDTYDVATNDVDVLAGADFSLTGTDTAVNVPSINANTGVITYTPAVSEAGADVTIEYEVCPDGVAGGSPSCDIATLTIAVALVPIDAVDDSGSGVVGVSDTYDVATNDVDVLAGADFSLTGTDTAVNVPSINANTGVITYTPAVSEAGADVTIEYEVCPDGVAPGSPSCDIATLTIAVALVPIDAVDDSGSGVVGVSDTYDVATNDVDVLAGADFSLTGTDTAVNVPSINANTGVITYTPAVSEAGADVTIEYEVCPDGVAGGSPSCDIATLTIAVALVPIDAVDDSGSGVVGVSDTYDVATNDVDVLAGADFSLTGTDTAVNVPSINANTGVITYTPAVSEAGADVTIEYEVCPDGVAGGSPSCDTATLTIAVALVPIDAVDDSGSGVVGVSDTYDVATNDVDVLAGADFSLTGTDTAVNVPSINANTGVITYTPAVSEAGADVTIEYEVCPDGVAAGDASCDTAVLTIAVDVLPIDAVDDNGSGVVGVSDNYDVATNDVDVLAGADFSLTGVDTAVNVPSINANTGVITYTPAVSEAGADVTIEYEVCPDGVASGSPSCDTATLTIAVDVLPIDAVDDSGSGVVDAADTYDVAANDLNVPAGADFSLTGTDTAVNVASIDANTGVITYTPDASESGADVTVEYEVCPDGVGAGDASCDTATLTIAVDVVVPPIDAVDDSGSGVVDVADTYDVASNDVDVPVGADFSLTGTDTAVNVASIDANTGVITYAPDASESGADVTVEYEVCPDGVGAGDASCDTATLTIAVDVVVPPIDAVDDSGSGVVDVADTYDVASNDVDVPVGADFSLTGTDTAVNVPSINANTGVITYTPDASESGADVTVEYEVCPDGVAAGDSLCDTATLTIAVAVVVPPIDAVDDNGSGVVDAADTYDVAGNDLNVPAGADFSLTGTDTAVNVPSINANTGVITYTPAASEAGADVTIEYEMCPDGVAAGDASCDTAVLTIAVDVLPIDAVDDNGSGVVDVADSYDVASNDLNVPAGADFSLTGTDTAVNVPSINANTGLITYTPAASEAGADVTIEYEVCPDGVGPGSVECDIATLTIAVDVLPIDAVDDSGSGVVDAADTYDVAANDLNVPAGADFSLTGTDTAVNTPSIDANTGVVTYTPDASESGADVTVEYEVCPDGVGAGDASCDTATLTIAVDVVVPPIDAVDDNGSGVVDSADTYDVASNDVDVPVGADFSLTGTDTAVNVPSIDANTGVITYTPDASESGADVTVEYEVCPDGVAAGDSLCDTATLTIAVAVVVPPIDAVDDSGSGVVDVADTYDVAGNDLNVPAGADFSLTGTDTAVNVPSIDANTGVITYTPDAAEAGGDVTIEYEVCPDGVAAGDASCDTATLTIAVAVVVPPIDAVDDSGSGVVDVADTYDVAGNDLNVPAGADFSLTGTDTAVNTPSIDPDTGVVTYTPDAAEAGGDVTVEYEVCPDGVAAGDASCDTATLTIAVDVVVPPIDAVDDSGSGVVDVADTYDVASNDVDVPVGADFSLTGTDTAVNTPSIDPDTGVVTYTPDAAEAGGDVTVEYEVCPDGVAAGDASCDTATLTIAVDVVVPPIDAVDDSGSGVVDVADTYDVAGNDLNVPAGADFSLTGTDTAVNTPSIDADTGVITYTPDVSESGADVTVEYEVCPDGVAPGSVECDTATLTIAVAVVVPPIDAVDDSGSGVVDVADTYDVASNDVDVPVGADFSLTGTDTAVNVPSINANTGLITYTPAASEAGADVTIEYEVCPDGVAAGDASCDTAVLTIAVDVLPIDAVDDNGSGVVDAADTYDVASNDVDVPVGADFSLTGTDTAVNVPSIDPDTGVVTYTPDAAEAGGDVTVEYEVCPDGVAPGSVECDTATLTIAVDVVVPPIDAVDDSGSGVVDVADTYDVASNDLDIPVGADFSLTGTDTAVNIPSINTNTGLISYAPAASEAGGDVTIEYEVCPDGVAPGSVECDTATLTIAVDVLPIDAVDDNGSGTVDAADTYDVAANDLNVPTGADFSLTGTDTAVNVPSIDADTGVIAYTPDASESGADVTIEYEVCPDGVAAGDASCDTAMLSIAVDVVIPPIDAIDDNGSGAVAVAATYPVAGNDIDLPIGADFSLTGTDTAVNTPLIDPDTGVVTYTPDASESGGDVTIEYEVCPDGVAPGSAECDTATLTIAVDVVVPPIDAIDDSGSGVVDVADTYDVASNDVDVPVGADFSLTGTDTAVNTPSIDATTGVITYTPDAAEAGSDVTVEYEVCPDGVAPGSAECDPATLTIAVAPVPIDAVDDSGSGVVNVTDTYDVASNDVDVPLGADFSLTGTDTAVNIPSIDPDTGVVTYTPDASESGADVTVEYEVCPDGVAPGSAECDTATLTIAVDVVIPPIDAVDDSGSGVVDAADTYDVASNDVDVPAGADFSLTGTDTAVNTPSIDPDAGVITYTPDAAEAGSDVTIEYEVCPDGVAAGDASCDTATLTVSVSATPLPIQLVDDEGAGEIGVSTDYPVASNDVNVPTGAVFSILANNGLGEAIIDSSTGLLTYTPVNADIGSDVTIDYQACPAGVLPGDAQCDIATLTVTVPAITAIADLGSAEVGTTATFDVATNDQDVPPGSDFRLLGDAAQGAATIDEDSGVVTYTPEASDAGQDVAITYEVCPDGVATGSLSCASAILTVTVRDSGACAIGPVTNNALADGTDCYQIDASVWYDADSTSSVTAADVALSEIEIGLFVSGADGTFGTTDDVQVAGAETVGGATMLFVDVAPGQYEVRVLTPPAGLTGTVDPDATIDNQHRFTITDSDIGDLQFAYAPASLIGTVLFDNAPFAGAQVTVTDSDGNSFIRTSDAAGRYEVAGALADPLFPGLATVSASVSGTTVNTTVVIVGATTTSLTITGMTPTPTPTPTPSSPVAPRAPQLESPQIVNPPGAAAPSLALPEVAETPLAHTGTEAQGLASLAMLVLVVGGVMTVAGRRMRRDKGFASDV